MLPTRYLQMIFPIFNTNRTREIFGVNPTVIPTREEANEVHIYVHEYNEQEIQHYQLATVADCKALLTQTNKIFWINIDGLRKADVDAVSKLFNIHFLITEDILSVAQRPKMDEVDDHLFCLLNMLYFNDKISAVEVEQVSMVIGNNYVISFQEDASRDVFNQLRDKLKLPRTKLRQSGTDYLCYTMLDLIVDNYFLVMEKLSDRLEALEEEIIKYGNTRSLARINSLRKELIVLKRNILPVRDLVNGFLRSESVLIHERTHKYYKDVYDHIVQAADLVENYRDMMLNMQDLYMSKVNMRMNEVMKVMAIVTCLLAPATVIGGIFGMNFDRIPYIHDKNGFFIAVGLMLLIPVWMVWIFKKRGWF
ncbi:MAG TPA: magnesium and cobalt transport protein CorA [Chitinophagaceae bacterium]|nr:magnesium and cobalt transport protein CorA [Chitinophagaceae bacterium]